jgi:hypothetical protein
VSWSKQELIQEAFSELALQGYVFNVGPDELQGALRRLDAMMATWNGQGIRLGYPISSTANGSMLDQDSKIPDWAIEATYLYLAIKIASGYGKQVSQVTAAGAKAALNVVMQRMAMPDEQQMPATMPVGAGNRRWVSGADRNPFFPKPTEPLLSGPDGAIDFD